MDRWRPRHLLAPKSLCIPFLAGPQSRSAHWVMWFCWRHLVASLDTISSVTLLPGSWAPRWGELLGLGGSGDPCPTDSRG